ncbi:hypothetical protein SCA03_10140 [Streptomyces cacaoi]|uniref:Uncharacterized protein n=1 Tax=Streptomyces cacaoi TaxID=1898 RepID=A0A4Y3QV08_STRCI|nr:hypothetical protein SCA03_10140 [Streptomyces cacaoi]
MPALVPDSFMKTAEAEMQAEPATAIGTGRPRRAGAGVLASALADAAAELFFRDMVFTVPGANRKEKQQVRAMIR